MSRCNSNYYFNLFRKINYYHVFYILFCVQFIYGDTEAYSEPKTYIIAKPINSNSNLSNETYIYEQASNYPDPHLSSENEVQEFTHNPYSYYYKNKYRSTVRPYYYPADNFKYYEAPEWRSSKAKSKAKSRVKSKGKSKIKNKELKSRRRYSKFPYKSNKYQYQYNNQLYDPDYPNTIYKPKGTGYSPESYDSYNDYGLGYKTKNKYGTKKQFQTTDNSADYDDFFNLDNIFDLSDDDLEDLDDKAEDLLFGDYEDPLQEETFVRPTIVGLNSGVKLASAGLNGISHVLPGVGFGGFRGLILSTLLGLPNPRFATGKLIGGGIKFFIALLLLPLILLFLPLPLFSPPPNPNNSQRNSSNGTQQPQSNQLIEFGRRVLSSENCIERISCEINHFNEITGMEAENIWFTRLMHAVSSFEGIFPDFLIRMARGYMSSTDDNSCSRFVCQKLSNNFFTT